MGLDYFGARHYAYGLYRFISTDPVLDVSRAIVNPQQWNRYSFCSNNPLICVDPTGMDNYVIYDPVNWSEQAAVEQKRLTRNNGERTHLCPVRTTKEFENAWNSMDDPTNVTLIFHSGSGSSASTTIWIARDQYLTTSPDGTTPQGSPAFCLADLKDQHVNFLCIWSCHSAEKANRHMNLVDCFYKLFSIKCVEGVIGPLNFKSPWTHWFGGAYEPKADTHFDYRCKY